jgi:hypothetical protein
MRQFKSDFFKNLQCFKYRLSNEHTYRQTYIPCYSGQGLKKAGYMIKLGTCMQHF